LSKEVSLAVIVLILSSLELYPTPITVFCAAKVCAWNPTLFERDVFKWEEVGSIEKTIEVQIFKGGVERWVI
jgi:hypothetical protein